MAVNIGRSYTALTLYLEDSVDAVLSKEIVLDSRNKANVWSVVPSFSDEAVFIFWRWSNTSWQMEITWFIT